MATFGLRLVRRTSSFCYCLSFPIPFFAADAEPVRARMWPKGPGLPTRSQLGIGGDRCQKRGRYNLPRQRAAGGRADYSLCVYWLREGSVEIKIWLLTATLLRLWNLASWTRGSDRYLEQGHGAEDSGWKHRPATHGELWLAAHEINIIDWVQPIALDPGIYHLSGDVGGRFRFRTRLSSRPTFWRQCLGLRGFDSNLPSGWRKGDLYFKLKNEEGSNHLQINGAGGEDSLRVIPSNRSVRLSGPPSDGATVIDLDGNSVASVAQKIHSSRPFEAPEGDPWTLLLTLFLLVAVSVYGWVMLGPSSGIEDPPGNRNAGEFHRGAKSECRFKREIFSIHNA